MAPEFEKAAIAIKDKANFGKVDVDSQMELAQKFEVMSIPTLIVLKNGQEANRAVGAKSKEEIIEEIQSVF